MLNRSGRTGAELSDQRLRDVFASQLRCIKRMLQARGIATQRKRFQEPFLRLPLSSHARSRCAGIAPSPSPIRHSKMRRGVGRSATRAGVEIDVLT